MANGKLGGGQAYAGQSITIQGIAISEITEGIGQALYNRSEKQNCRQYANDLLGMI